MQKFMFKLSVVSWVGANAPFWPPSPILQILISPDDNQWSCHIDLLWSIQKFSPFGMANMLYVLGSIYMVTFLMEFVFNFGVLCCFRGNKNQLYPMQKKEYCLKWWISQLCCVFNNLLKILFKNFLTQNQKICKPGMLMRALQKKITIGNHF